MSILSEAIAELLVNYDEAQAVEAKISQENEDAIGALGMYLALQLMGLDFKPGDAVNKATLSAKISSDVLGGEVVFSNLFDKQEVIADVRRIALARAASAYGFEGGLGIAGLRDKLVSDILADIHAEIEVGAGDYIDAAADSARALKVIDAPIVDGANEPVDFSAKGVANRERQARYRAAHKRVWVDL